MKNLKQKFPTHEMIEKAMLDILSNGKSFTKKDLVERVANKLNLTQENKNKKTNKGTENLLSKNVGLIKTKLKKQKIMSPINGEYKLNINAELINNRKKNPKEYVTCFKDELLKHIYACLSDPCHKKGKRIIGFESISNSYNTLSKKYITSCNDHYVLIEPKKSIGFVKNESMKSKKTDSFIVKDDSIYLFFDYINWLNLGTTFFYGKSKHSFVLDNQYNSTITLTFEDKKQKTYYFDYDFLNKNLLLDKYKYIFEMIDAMIKKFGKH